jgi:predicted Zn-dependent protease
VSFTRRSFGEALCSCTLLALAGRTAAQTGAGAAGREFVAPGHRPLPESDEKGLWGLMDRVEREVRGSRFLIRDRDVNEYVREVVCGVASRHCADVRTYIVRTPHFNASMAPNGMMQIWTGLLLRCHDEAQFAAIVGHEMGHYLRRHTVERWRDARNKTDFAAFLGLGLALAGVGWAGSLTQAALLASIFAFSRDQEREADEIGLDLIANAGYPPVAASEVWEQLLAELKGSTADRDNSLVFASHPQPEERLEAMRSAAAARGGATGDRRAERYRARLAPLRTRLLTDELALRQYGRSEILFEQLLAAAPEDGQLWYVKGELYRLRSDPDDGPKALAAYQRGLEAKGAPPEIHRSIGLVELKAGARDRAQTAFDAYLKAKPDATDAEALRALLAP